MFAVRAGLPNGHEQFTEIATAKLFSVTQEKRGFETVAAGVFMQWLPLVVPPYPTSMTETQEDSSSITSREMYTDAQEIYSD